MRIRNPSLLRSFSGPGTCGGCKIPVHSRSPHHCRTKGSGGSDVRCNIIPLCNAFTQGMNCHRKHHDGNGPTTDELLAVIAKREKIEVVDIEAFHAWLLQLDQRSSVDHIEYRLEELTASQIVLARKELKIAGVMP